MKNKLILGIATLLIGIAIGSAYLANRASPTAIAEMQAPVPSAEPNPIMGSLQDVLAAYRKIIVLFADENTLGANEREMANQVGQTIFHENRQRIVDLEAAFESLVSSGKPQRFETLASILDYIESNPDLYDADRLAFRELLRSLQAVVAKDGSLPAIKLHKRISEDLDALAEIERNYEKEIQIGRASCRERV